MVNDPTGEAMNAVFRAEVGLICGSLVRITGDFDLAEDLVQDAVVVALQRWPVDGVPERPAAWLLQTARRRAIDRLRRDSTYRAKLQLLTDGWAPDVRSDPDDRLRLIFTCCHPALARDAQVALTLRAVMGMTTSQIAHAFLVSEATMAQRIVRAKRKIVGAHIPYRVPDADELPDRLAEVLASLYIVFNEGYLGSGPDVSTSRDLCVDALWLCGLLARMLPEEPEVLALLALMRLHESRRATRFDARGALVLLRDQDRTRWDHAAIAEAGALLEQARRLGRPGSVLAAGRDRRLPRRGARPSRRPTGRRSSRSTAHWCGSIRGRWSASIARSRSSTWPGRSPRWRSSTRCAPTWTATTCTGRRVRSCFAASAGSTRRPTRIGAPSS